MVVDQVVQTLSAIYGSQRVVPFLQKSAIGLYSESYESGLHTATLFRQDAF
jgi:hypothetical protein